MYTCRHSGVCCSSDWPIPIETDRQRLIEHAHVTGQLRVARGRAATIFIHLPGAPRDTPAVIARNDGRCVFHTGACRCAIHEHLGHSALPLACRQFPRVTVLDPRGACVTLSHFCPTARDLLGHDPLKDAGHDIVVNPQGFPPGGEYVGLDARDALPPLLCPDVLMDWDAWWRLEERAVATLLHEGGSADEALAVLREVVGRVSRWRPGRESLLDVVEDAWERRDAAPAPAADLIRRAVARVPEHYRPQAEWTASVETPDLVTRRFLAAHAFGNWQVHARNGGVSAWLESIETARAFLSHGAGVGHTDLVLRHLAIF
jgi:Fe-S-cluster containining protein